jgi:DNA-binding XRE family transcriptional regulator
MNSTHPLRAWRKERNMSLATLAKTIGRVQVPHLCEIELRKKTPSVRLAQEIAQLTGLSLEQVVGK